MPFDTLEWAGFSLDPHADPCCDGLKGLPQEMPAIQNPLHISRDRHPRHFQYQMSQ